jgi:hypothetical protein
VSNVVAQCSHAKKKVPVWQLVFVMYFVEKLSDLGVNMFGIHNDVIDPTSRMHDAE